ncbi:hypothetical protein NDU88_001102 [Pleurodeles waltl]|uniref:Uncharacterized protein n=1 Tax=Pleurodeles waltl TaxID=8319 RepID=A0AAV7WML3_PLEWA|nr:hypothetical protein NDU88_001102 [Pleurodeles waltl]
MSYCNRASIATVTKYSPEPAGSYPGGTPWRIDNPEVISNADIRDRTTEKGEERTWDAHAGGTEGAEHEERERESGTESEPEERIKAEEEEDDGEDADTPRNHEQRRRVLGGRCSHRYERTLE